MMLARNTIELYLSLPHEEANPVPADELLRGRVVALSLRRYEPVGVVVAITPYNGAIIMAFQKLIPALMAGNSVILRPSPLTPISSLAFGAAAEAAGLPAGVLAWSSSTAPRGAELLTTDPAVDMVSFTGSTAVGRQILAQAAPTVKRVALELGGKSAQIYLPDAAAPGGGRRGPGRGHDGRSGVRGRHPDARARRSTRTRSSRRSAPHTARIKVGPPSDPAAMMGPLISAAQRERCERFVALAEEHGGKVVVGGGRPAGLERGLLLRAHRARPSRQLRTPPRRTRSSDPSSRSSATATSTTPCGSPTTACTGFRARSTVPTRPRRPSVARRIRSGAVNVNTVDVQRLRPERRLQAERSRSRARHRRHPRLPGNQASVSSANCRPEPRRREVTMTARPEPGLADLGRRPHPGAARTSGWTGWRPRTAIGRRTWRSSTAWTTGSTTASATRARA